MKKVFSILIYVSLCLVSLELDASSCDPQEHEHTAPHVRERSPSSTSKIDEERSGHEGPKEGSKPEDKEEADDFSEDISQWIPPKTWWETLISITPERKKAFIKLGLEQELIAAQNDIGKGLRLQKSGGKGALEYILDEEENKQYLLEKVRKKRAMIRAQIRLAREKELLSEREARQVNESLLQEEKDQDSIERKPQPASFWWRFFGYTEKNEQIETLSPRKEVEGFVIVPRDPPNDKVEKVEQDDTPCHGKVSQYLKDKTPVEKWDEPSATWFWKKGANQVIKNQEEDDQPVAYTQDEIDQLFRTQIQIYLEQETLGAFWGDSIWAYLLEHKDSLPPLKVEELTDDRLHFSSVQTYLINQTSGELWREDSWFWFMKKGHVQFDLGERGMVCGADLIEPLFEHRKVLENFREVMFQSPKLWDDEVWNWFEANGRGRTLASVEITDKLFALMCEQRKEEKDEEINEHPSNKGKQEHKNPYLF